jgi:hypothetical protein
VVAAVVAAVVAKAAVAARAAITITNAASLLDEPFPGRSATPKVRSGAFCARYSDALKTRDL